MTIDDKFLLIRNYHLWSALSDEDMQELNVLQCFMKAKKGDYIYFDSHLHNRLYFVKEGYVKIGYVKEDGDEVIKEIISRGEIFGQFTLERNNLNGEFAQAYKNDVCLCSFKIEDFENILQRKPQLAITFSKMVGNKLRDAEFRLINLLNNDVRSRLLSFMYRQCLNHGETKDQRRYICDNFFTHDDIARLIGASRQTVTSTINQLEKEGLLFMDRRQILVPNLKKIENAAIVG
ncbi:Crp/Fnr family transcriptional regulator [Niabella insulamsoli]|uniref:Crp/Fnr family transcriptional regulator n=1 Tax=Niabella insulamsoli TaxID=3144874 RepID=UPI0031FDCC94